MNVGAKDDEEPCSGLTPSPHVIIYGTHSHDWMEALEPAAPVWEAIFKDEEPAVELIGDTLPPPRSGERRTVIIPLMEDHIESCLDACPEPYSTLLPCKDALRILRDKANFAAYAEAESLSHFCPRHYSNPEMAQFPCVLKRTNLNASNGVEVASSLVHLQELLTNPMWHDHPIVLQELIATSCDYVAHCVTRDGRILYHCGHKYDLKSEALIRRSGAFRELMTLTRPQLDIIERFLLPLRYTGPCNVDFKVLPDGQMKVLEINPRLGGSLMRPENIQELKSTLLSIITAARPTRIGSFRVGGERRDPIMGQLEAPENRDERVDEGR